MTTLGIVAGALVLACLFSLFLIGVFLAGYRLGWRDRIPPQEDA